MTVPGPAVFARIAREELSAHGGRERDGIGLYGEKRLHSVFKRWAYDDFAAHEVRVPRRDGSLSRFVADVMTPAGDIFEVQTGSLFPMQKKIRFYLEETDFHVTVIHPLMGCKHVSWIDPESGEIPPRGRRKSPKREGVFHGLAALNCLSEFLGHPRLAVLLPVVEAEEYRLLDGWGNGGKRGSHRYEVLATALLDTHAFSEKEDFAAVLPDLPDDFTAKEFGKITGLVGYDLYDALALYTALGIFELCGKRGRARVWKRA